MSSEDISGTRKAAAFLLSLPQEEAAKVLAGLEESVLAEVASAMKSLGKEFATGEAVDALYRDVARILNSKRGVRRPDDDQLRERFVAALGEERAAEVLEEIRIRRLEERPFAIVESYPPHRLAGVMADESSASIALVLAHVDPAYSAQVLAHFEPEKALESVRRMATLTPPSFHTLRAVAETLETGLAEAEDSPVGGEPSQRLQTIADMLTFSGSETERTVLEGLGDEDEQMVEEIREYMFTWTDLASVDQRSMQKILSSVDTRTLAIALKGSPPEVERNIMNNLSARVKDMVVDERELAGKLPMSEVREARGETLKGVRALMESGEFKPMKGGEELVD